ncbi:glycosyl transferase [Pilimelia anulata]|uniref:Glycosyl transferase n=1 Tax=Pilimelia anulata TaxID=53371 RepID=A0A8J3FBJ9_9ACTN|nr:glycosyl transferase [Pilimelia anulata]
MYFPLVPLGWALRAAGHDVLVGAPASFDEPVRQSGLPLAAVSGPVEMADVMSRDRAGQPVAVPRTDAEMTAGVGTGFGRLAARTLAGTSELVRGWGPDVIVTESYSFAPAAVAAALHGVPWVLHTVGPGDLPIRDGVARELAPELAELGLAGIGDPDLVLDNCPPLLGEPAAPAAERVRYVPYGEPGIVPDWCARRATRPRILVTLGSVQPAIGGLPLLAELVRAVATLPVELVVAVADYLVDRLGPLPANVLAAGWQSLTSVLPGCSAVVHHGGPGTMMACVHAGLPQVIIPGRGKPHDAIRRLVEFGAARALPPEQVTPGAVRDACAALLDAPAYGQRARAARDLLGQLRSPVDAVPLVTALADGHRRPPRTR